MNITWTITKKHGNLRPNLSYSVHLDEHEKSLALPPVSIVSTIPQPEEDRQEYCYPGQFERSSEEKNPTRFHRLEAPSHRGQSWTYSLRLPWRENNDYPEVEESFLLLRDAVERELANAGRSVAMQVEGSVSTSDAAKTAIAPSVLAARFLKIAEKSKHFSDRTG